MILTDTLRDVLLARAATDSDRVAYAERERRITYAELLASATSLASELRTRGVRPNDRVALIHSAGIRFAELFWAIQLLGAIPVAFNPYVPSGTARRRAERVKPSLIITDRDREELSHRGTSESYAFFQPTSGTTGESQAVMIRHRSVIDWCDTYVRQMNFTRDDIHVSWVPPWHDLGLVRFIIVPVFGGEVCHFVEPSIATIPEWLRTISEVRGTLSGAPDFAYRLATRLVDPKTVDLSSLRFSTNGGEPVRLSTIRAFEKRFNVREGVVQPGYGLAEGTLGVTVHRPGERVKVDEHGNVSCGRPSGAYEVKIDGGPPGEILVRGPYLFDGYFENEEATRRVLRDGWLHTGDIGHLDDEGNLYVLGRRRAMLKRGGAVLAPRELEEAAQEVEGVRIVAAVGIPTGDSTEVITLVAESQTPSNELIANIADAIRRTCGFAPERVLLVPPRTIPRTYNGKIRYDALRSAIIDGTIPSGAA